MPKSLKLTRLKIITLRLSLVFIRRFKNTIVKMTRKMEIHLTQILPNYTTTSFNITLNKINRKMTIKIPNLNS